MYILQFTEKVLKLFFNKRAINKIKCLYCSFFLKSYFNVVYKDNNFEITFKNGMILKFNETPFLDLLNTLNGYFKNYDLKRGDYVIDGGAYAGTFAIYASKIIGNEGKIIAFEPDLHCFEKLLQNIKINDAKNIVALNKGLWDNEEILEFDSRGEKDSMIVKCLNEPVKGNIKKYAFVKLDEELKNLGINKVDFIKMDIEGAEIEAIKGCRETLEKNNVNLAIASYHIRNGEKTCKRLESFLKSVGYEPKTEFPKHLTTYAFKKEK